MRKWFLFFCLVLVIGITALVVRARDQRLIDSPIKYPEKPDPSVWPAKIFMASLPPPLSTWPVPTDSEGPICLPVSGPPVLYIQPPPPPLESSLQWVEEFWYRNELTGGEYRKVEGHWCTKPCFH